MIQAKATQSGQKSSFLFWLLVMFVSFRNVYGLALRKSFKLLVAYLPSKIEIRMRLNVIHVPEFLILDIDQILLLFLF